MFKKILKAIESKLDKIAEAKKAKKKQDAVDRVNHLANKGELIGNKPEGVALKIYNKNYYSYINCIFLSVNGRIGSRDRIKTGNRFKVKMKNGRYSVWSIISKETEQWKWDTCHDVKGIFVGWLKS